MAVYQLDKDLWFPDPHLGEDDGLVAVGGDLSVDRLLLAYSNGFFPWFSFKNQQEPLWFCPLQRFVIFPSEIHVSHSMQQLINKGRYKLTMNEDFDFAASFEVWDDDRLVGGLYGVNLGNAFFGESMFSLVPNASKLALIHLARIMELLGGQIIDCQLETPHLRSMGGRFIPYEEYLQIIRK